MWIRNGKRFIGTHCKNVSFRNLLKTHEPTGMMKRRQRASNYKQTNTVIYLKSNVRYAMCCDSAASACQLQLEPLSVKRTKFRIPLKCQTFTFGGLNYYELLRRTKNMYSFIILHSFIILFVVGFWQWCFWAVKPLLLLLFLCYLRM